MGDSFASAPGLTDTEGSCGRSREAAPGLARDVLADELEVTRFVHVACVGATTADLPAQLAEAERSSTGPYDLVTVSFGGNDIGYWQILLDCFGADELLGDESLLDELVEGIDCDVPESEIDERIDRLRQPLETLYRRLLEPEVLAPGGHVVVMGYPSLFADPEEWSPFEGRRCDGIGRADAAAFGRLAIRLGDVIEAVTSGFDRVRFVDPAVAFAGHARCHPDPWINGITIDIVAGLSPFDASFHPTAEGHRALAGLLVAELRELYGGSG